LTYWHNVGPTFFEYHSQEKSEFKLSVVEEDENIKMMSAKIELN